MTLSLALRSGRLDDLPGRRDEDWRWTDLRTALDPLPPPSPPGRVPSSSALLEAFSGETRVILNGRLLAPQTRSPEGRLFRRFVSTAERGGHDVVDDLTVPAGGSLVLLDLFEGQAKGYVSSVRGAVRVGPGARVERLVLCSDHEDAVSVGAFDVTLAQGAAFAQTTLCDGALRQRLETSVELAADADVRLDGLYLLGDRRHSDQTTRVLHSGRGGRSRQLVKGLVAGRARAVFQGRIVVARGASGADARMGSHGRILGDRAEIDVKPELEIYADDVQCAHGNTVGAFDADSLFYARSRGMSESEAKKMLAAGFIGEVLERVEDVELRAIAARWLDGRLEAVL